MKTKSPSNADHTGQGMALSKMVNGVPTIITDKQVNLRLTALNNLEDMKKLREVYRQGLAAAKKTANRNQTAVNHYKALIDTATRMINKLGGS